MELDTVKSYLRSALKQAALLGGIGGSFCSANATPIEEDDGAVTLHFTHIYPNDYAHEYALYTPVEFCTSVHDLYVYVSAYLLNEGW